MLEWMNVSHSQVCWILGGSRRCLLGCYHKERDKLRGKQKCWSSPMGGEVPAGFIWCCPPRTEHAHSPHEVAWVVLDPSCQMEVSIGCVRWIYRLAVVALRGVPFQVRALNFYPVLSSPLACWALGSGTSFLRQCSRWPQMLEEPRELNAGILGSCGRLGCRASSSHLSLQSSSFDRAQLLPNAERNCPPLPGWNLSRIMPRHDYLKEQKW